MSGRDAGSVSRHVDGSVNRQVAGSVSRHVDGSVNRQVAGTVGGADFYLFNSRISMLLSLVSSQILAPPPLSRYVALISPSSAFSS